MILIVEDNPTQQKVLAYLAKRNGFDARIVSTGTEAFNAIAVPGQETYDLLLMDWTLPDMTGLECTTLIRKWEAAGLTHVPIIALTGHALDGDREKCLQSGMDDYLSKPFTADDFRDMVLRWIPAQESAPEFGYGAFPTDQTHPRGEHHA